MKEYTLYTELVDFQTKYNFKYILKNIFKTEQIKVTSFLFIVFFIFIAYVQFFLNLGIFEKNILISLILIVSFSLFSSIILDYETKEDLFIADRKGFKKQLDIAMFLKKANLLKKISKKKDFINLIDFMFFIDENYNDVYKEYIIELEKNEFSKLTNDEKMFYLIYSLRNENVKYGKAVLDYFFEKDNFFYLFFIFILNKANNGNFIVIKYLKNISKEKLLSYIYLFEKKENQDKYLNIINKI